VFAYTSFSPTLSFHPLCHRNQFSPTSFALWVHPLADLMHLQISTTHRFHLLVDFTYPQISSTGTCLVETFHPPFFTQKWVKKNSCAMNKIRMNFHSLFKYSCQFTYTCSSFSTQRTQRAYTYMCTCTLFFPVVCSN